MSRFQSLSRLFIPALLILIFAGVTASKASAGGYPPRSCHHSAKAYRHQPKRYASNWAPRQKPIYHAPRYRNEQPRYNRYAAPRYRWPAYPRY